VRVNAAALFLSIRRVQPPTPARSRRRAAATCAVRNQAGVL